MNASRLAASGLAVLLAALGLSALALGLGAPATARAAAPVTVVVNDLLDGTHPTCASSGTGTCTLRDALTFANSQAGPASITFSGMGTITLTAALPAISGTQGIDGGGVITLSGADQFQVLKINAGAQVSLQGLTIAHGHSGSLGGGLSSAGTLTIDNSTFSRNSATSDISGTFVTGGGIYIASGSVTISNSTFDGNTAATGGLGGDSFGGGLYIASGSLTISNSTFSRNAATTRGGVLAYGGGLYIYSGLVTISNSTLNSNTASWQGGAIFSNGVVTVTNSTLVDNSASYQGGGIFSHGVVTVTNSTLVNNTAITGGGAVNPSGSLTLRDTLLGHGATGTNCAGTISADRFNLADDGSCASATVTTAAALQLSPLGPNGGPTWTVALGLQSAAIDAGDDATCAATDQRGVKRPQAAHCDVGAYELGGLRLYFPLVRVP